jgi:hypothetical protein
LWGYYLLQNASINTLHEDNQGNRQQGQDQGKDKGKVLHDVIISG